MAEQNDKVSILLDGDNQSDHHHLAILCIVRPATKSQVSPDRHLKLNWSKGDTVSYRYTILFPRRL